MPGQFEEELNRAATHVTSGLDKLGKFLRAKTDEVVKGAKELGAEAKEKLEKDVLPGASQRLREVTEHVTTHGGLTKRRVTAEANELLRDPAALEKQKTQEFELAKTAVTQKVKMHSVVRAFLASDDAVLPGFDNTTDAVKGIAVYPAEARMKLLQHEYVQRRIFIGADGLTCREYTQNLAAIEDTKQPQYKFKEERAATPDDLFQMQVTSQEVFAAISGLTESPRFRSFQTKRAS